MRWNRVLNVVGCHAEGEVGNVVVGGFGDVPGETMFDKRNHLQEHEDMCTYISTVRSTGIGDKVPT